MAGGKIGFEYTGIGALLRSGRLTVPPNQRSYAWEEDHVLDLFTDLSGAIKDGDTDYFLGTVVLTGEGVPDVSDGQQRLATTSILLATIRDYFQKEGKPKKARQIDQDYLRTIDLKTDETKPRLGLNADDQQFFINNVLLDAEERTEVAPHENLRESNHRILRAAQLARQHIGKIVAPYNPKDAEEVLVRWVTFLDESAKVVVVRVTDSALTYRMFETLNDRGLRASQADLLKNYFFSKTTKIEEANARWSSIAGAVESVGSDDLLVTYIRHFWITQHGPTKERELADSIRKKISGDQKTRDFLRQLDEAAPDYVALFNPGHSKWNKYKGVVRTYVQNIDQDLKVEQIRPLLFAVARKFSPEEAVKALKMLVSWSVRFLISGGRGGVLDRNYSLCAHEIGIGKITKAKQLLAAMKDLIPNDATFEEDFKKARVSQAFLARYYLRTLDRKMRGEDEPEYIANPESDVINLEHVMPKTPSQAWRVDPEVAAACERRIGNMVLLQATKNVAAGNSSFSDKKKTYQQSNFLITKEVAKSSAWSLEQINTRQSKLAKIAVKTWPIG
ncbi:DUF262 domain-containing protein [Bradyrhizobium sp. USDA 4486]